MGFFDKKPSAIAMLGNAESLKMLKSSSYFETYDINLINKDFVTFDEVKAGFKENKNVEYLLISDTALLGHEDGKYEIVKKVREINENVFIAFLMNHEKPDEKFRNWAFGYSVYNIYYALDDDGSFDFDKIMQDLAAKQMPVKQLPFDITQKENELLLKEKEISNKQSELLDRENQLNELQSKLEELQNTTKSEIHTDKKNTANEAENEVEIENLKNKILEMQKGKLVEESFIENLKKSFENERTEILEAVEKEKSEYRKKIDEDAKAHIEEIKAELEQSVKSTKASAKKKSLGSITIGAFSLSHGAGATFTSIVIGEALSNAGYKVAVVAFDDTVDLQYKAKKEKRIASYIVPKKDQKKTELIKVFSMDFDFIIVDFGCLFSLSPFGKLNQDVLLSDKKMEIDEFLRCHYKIGLGFSAPWHEGKLDFFINNDMVDENTCIFPILGIDNWDRSKKYELNICERDNATIEQVLFNLLGI